MSDGSQRRLAAIVAIDVAGYSRLMGADEEGTIAALQSHRQEVVDPKLAQYNGRIANTAGDSLLVEFPSAVDALRCAVELQEGFARRNEDVPDERRLQYRIGINVGDVVSQGDDLLGNGVNVAARLEALADPGGICISRSARDQVRDRVDIGLADMGQVEVKNIARPVRVFRVLAAGEEAGCPTPTAPWWRYIAATIVVGTALLGGGVWWWLQPPPFKPVLPLPSQQSIVVVPFDIRTGDESQEYIGDGMTENIIAVLASSRDLFVIGRDSSFSLKGGDNNAREIAEKFGVQYVLSGSVQREERTLRVTAQLVDASKQNSIWSKSFDGRLDELFSIQDQITREIFLATQVTLSMGESARIYQKGVNEFDTLFLIAEANPLFGNQSPENHVKAERLFRQALAKEPDSFTTNLWMGRIYQQKITQGISKNIKGDFEKAWTFAQKALAIKEDASVLALLSALSLLARQHDAAISYADRVVEEWPMRGLEINIAGWVKSWSGQPKEGAGLMERAMRLDPIHFPWMRGNLANAYTMIGEYDRSKSLLQQNLKIEAESYHTRRWPYVGLIAIAVFQGDLKTARRLRDELLKVEPTFSLAVSKKLLSLYKDQRFAKRFLDALEQAGIPKGQVRESPKYPSVAVLPFRNLSGDHEFDALAEGLAFEISDRLAKLKMLRVVGRSLMSRFGQGAIEPEEIRKGMKKPVDYLVSASVQVGPKRVRVFAELLSTRDSRQIWSKTYDGDLSAETIFEFQRDVALSIVTAVAGGYGAIARVNRKNIDLSANKPLNDYQCTVVTFLMFEKGISAAEHLGARDCWEQIVKKDREHADAWGWLAMLYYYEKSNRLNPRPKSFERSLSAARKAVNIDRKSQIGHLGLATANFGLRRDKEFQAAAQKTLSLNPTNYSVIPLAAFLLDHSQFSADHEKSKELSVKLFKNAAKIDPFAPFWYFLPLMEDAHKAGDYKAALELSLAHDLPGFHWAYIRRAMYYAQLGENEKAAENVREILKRQPDFGGKIRSQLKAWGSTKELLERYVRDLRKAGIDIPNEGS